MQIYEIGDEKFRKYGRVLKGIDTSELVEVMRKLPIPQEVVYEPSVKVLENLEIAEILKEKVFGELPIQVGYCIGNNDTLNAVEYHRNSEINIAATDAILILGCQQDITEDFYYDTAKMEAFFIPKGCVVELYATTLHYAPCNSDMNGFQVAVVLPRGTNYPLEQAHADGEDALLAAKNKWLIGHKNAGLPKGTYLGLLGENLTV